MFYKITSMILGLLRFIQCSSGILLIITILLHSPKGEGLGSIGGSAHLFKAGQGLESGLNRLTAILAIIFMLSAGLLSALS